MNKKLYSVCQYNPKSALGQGERVRCYVVATSAHEALRLFLNCHDEVGSIDVNQADYPLILEETI